MAEATLSSAQLPREAVGPQLQKLLASKSFLPSQRLVQLLHYLVDLTVRGQSSKLKEYAIGIDVFGKDDSYDPRTDPIVRVEVGRLRSKLLEYYSKEGQGDSIIIDIPKGSYVPSFNVRGPLPIQIQHDGAGMLSDSGVEGSARFRRHSIAVLPFLNMTPEPETEYFSDGLTEELINILAKIRGLRVVARTSAWAFKGKPNDIRAIGRVLNVEAILEGSVRKAGDRIRVTAQLNATTDGFHLWSESYERKIGDVFAIQDEISRVIVDKLRIQLQGDRTHPIAKRDTVNVAAYKQYLRGRYCLHKGGVDGLNKSIEHFEQAIQLDPNSASAYSGIADAFVMLACYGMLKPREVLPDALAAARKALSIDESLAEAHALLGFCLGHYEWKWNEACREYDRSLHLNPGYAAGHQWYSWTLATMGQLERAMEEARKALNLDPLSPLVRSSLGRLAFYSRRFSRAKHHILEAIQINPNFFISYLDLGLLLAHQGHFSKARTTLKKLREVSSDSPMSLALHGFSSALSGNRLEALRILDELQKRSIRNYVSPECMAMVYLGLGEIDRTFEWLSEAWEDRLPGLGLMKVSPVFDSLRSDPRLTALLRMMNLEP